MNKNVYEIIKEKEIHPNFYAKSGNVYIIGDKKEKYALKLKTNNYDIYKYLISRDFVHFPENLSNKIDNYDLSKFILDQDIPEEERLHDYIEILAILHHKTGYKRQIDLDEIKKDYEKMDNEIKDASKYYYDFNEMADKETFFSPSHYLLVRNISLFYNLLNYGKKTLDSWYINILKEKSIDVSLIHNNPNINHLLVSDNRYLISCDKSCFDNPINDIEKFFRKYYHTFSLEMVLDWYTHINKINKLNLDLLLIHLAIPKIISFSSNEYENTKLVSKEITFLKKIHEYVVKRVK